MLPTQLVRKPGCLRRLGFSAVCRRLRYTAADRSRRKLTRYRPLRQTEIELKLDPLALKRAAEGALLFSCWGRWLLSPSKHRLEGEPGREGHYVHVLAPGGSRCHRTDACSCRRLARASQEPYRPVRPLVSGSVEFPYEDSESQARVEHSTIEDRVQDWSWAAVR